MFLKQSSFFLILLLALFSCGKKQEKSNPEPPKSEEPAPYAYNEIPVVANMEKAHKVESYHAQEAVAFDIELYFRGKLRLDANISLLTGSGKIRLDKKDGTSLIWDGKEVWVNPADKGSPSARFDMFTWQYFFEAPYKFSDPGTYWENTGEKSLDDQPYNTAKLTFAPGTGDSHKDWYLVYSPEKTSLVYAMAYIVTFSKSEEEASVEPHAISYTDYRDVEGIPMAHRWDFWMWTEEQGIFDSLGYAHLQNIRFFTPEPEHFTLTGDKAPVPYERKE